MTDAPRPIVVPEAIVQKAVNAFHLKNPAHSSNPQLCATGVRAAIEAVVDDLRNLED